MDTAQAKAIDTCYRGEKKQYSQYRGKLNCFELENIIIIGTFINLNMLLEITVTEYI